MKKITMGAALFAVMLVFFAGCKTAQFNFVSEIQEQDIRELEAIELDILRLRFETDEMQAKKLSAAIEKQIAAGKARKSLNPNYNAWLYGLEGEAASLALQTEKVNAALARIQQSGGNTVWSYILASSLETDAGKKIAVLKQAPQTGIVELKLALAYFDADEYAPAVAAFDNAFGALPEEYASYYRPKRDMAYQFMYNPPKNAAAKQLFGEKTLTLEQIISAATEHGALLQQLALKPLTPLADIYLALQERGYVSPSASLFLPFSRAQTARFVAMLSRPSSLQAVLSRADAYKKRGRSPVPDVQLENEYFPYIIYVLEKELMELPDGSNFFPDQVISGMDYNKSLEKILPAN